MAAPLILPAPLQGSVEALARRLLQPTGAPGVDFSVPPGEPALLPPQSVSWRVFKNPVTMFIGGVAAVLLELGEPRVRHGVWDNTSFRSDPLARLQRTGLAAMMTVYGPQSTARAMIDAVNQMHERVSGTTSAGQPYRASDPELLSWVQATAAFGFLEAYAAFASPLSSAQRDLYYAEAAPIAALYGATGAPTSEADWQALLGRMLPLLEPSRTILDFLSIMRRVEALPRPLRPLQALLIKAAVDILPDGIAAQLRLGREWRLRRAERIVVEAMARAGNRLLIRSWPAAQACRRLGLAEDHLYT